MIVLGELSSNETSPLKSSEGNVWTAPQLVIRSSMFRRVGLEWVISLFVCGIATTLPVALQRHKCSTELADRSPPFQLLESSDEVILDSSLNYPKLSSTISSKSSCHLQWAGRDHGFWITMFRCAHQPLFLFKPI